MTLCKIIFICTLRLILSVNGVEEATTVIKNDGLVDTSQFFKTSDVILVPNRLREIKYSENDLSLPTHEASNNFRKVFHLINRPVGYLSEDRNIDKLSKFKGRYPVSKIKKRIKNFDNFRVKELLEKSITDDFYDKMRPSNPEGITGKNVEQNSARSLNLSKEFENKTVHHEPLKVKYIFTNVKDGKVDDLICTSVPKSRFVENEDEKSVQYTVRLFQPKTDMNTREFGESLGLLRQRLAHNFKKYKNNERYIIDHQRKEEEPAKLPVVESNVPNYFVDKVHNEIKLKKKYKIKEEHFQREEGLRNEKKDVNDENDELRNWDHDSSYHFETKNKLGKISANNFTIHEVAPTIIKLDKNYNKDFNPNDYKIDRIEEMKSMLAEQSTPKKVQNVKVEVNEEEQPKNTKAPCNKMLINKNNFDSRLAQVNNKINSYPNFDNNVLSKNPLQDIVIKGDLLTKLTMNLHNLQNDPKLQNNKKNLFKCINDNNKEIDNLIEKNKQFQNRKNNIQINYNIEDKKNDIQDSNYNIQENKLKDSGNNLFQENNLHPNQINNILLNSKNNLEDGEIFMQQNNPSAKQINPNKFLLNTTNFEYPRDGVSENTQAPSKKNCKSYDVYSLSDHPKCFSPAEKLNEKVYNSSGAFQDFTPTSVNTRYPSDSNLKSGNIVNIEYNKNRAEDYKSNFGNNKNTAENYKNTFNINSNITDSSYKNSNEIYTNKNLSEGSNNTKKLYPFKNLAQHTTDNKLLSNNLDDYKSPVDKFYVNPVLSFQSRPTEHFKNVADVYKTSGANFKTLEEFQLSNQEDNDELEGQLYRARINLAEKTEEIADLEKSSLLDKQFIIHLMSELLFTLQHVQSLAPKDGVEAIKDNSSGIILEKGLHEISILTNSIVEVEKLARYFETINESASDAKEDMDISLGTTMARIAALKQKLSVETKLLAEEQRKIQDSCKKKRKRKKFRLFSWKKQTDR